MFYHFHSTPVYRYVAQDGINNFLFHEIMLQKNGLTYYSQAIIHHKTIWWAAFFWEEQASNESAIPEFKTSSERRDIVCFPLRETPSIIEVSVFPRESKESKTLSTERWDQEERAVSFPRRWICSCVRDIFLYNDVHTLWKLWQKSRRFMIDSSKILKNTVV